MTDLIDEPGAPDDDPEATDDPEPAQAGNAETDPESEPPAGVPA